MLGVRCPAQQQCGPTRVRQPPPKGWRHAAGVACELAARRGADIQRGAQLVEFITRLASVSRPAPSQLQGERPRRQAPRLRLGRSDMPLGTSASADWPLDSWYATNVPQHLRCTASPRAPARLQAACTCTTSGRPEAVPSRGSHRAAAWEISSCSDLMKGNCVYQQLWARRRSPRRSD